MSRIPEIEAGIRALCDATAARARPVRSEWFFNDLMKAYVRFGPRYFGQGQSAFMLTLAVFEVHDPVNYGKGLKNELFDFAEAFATEHKTIRGVYVECANNPDLNRGLVRRGYAIRPGTDVLGDGVGADWFKLVKPVEASDPIRADDL